MGSQLGVYRSRFLKAGGKIYTAAAGRIMILKSGLFSRLALV
jgi:hypothetical protein